ncbi:hypothetical protein Efla_001857 [Eimeria flavescens]
MRLCISAEISCGAAEALSKAPSEQPRMQQNVLEIASPADRKLRQVHAAVIRVDTSFETGGDYVTQLGYSLYTTGHSALFAATQPRSCCSFPVRHAICCGLSDYATVRPLIMAEGQARGPSACSASVGTHSVRDTEPSPSLGAPDNSSGGVTRASGCTAEHGPPLGHSCAAQDKRRVSLSSLWGSNKPQPRVRLLATGFPRQTGPPFGCAVLSASAAVRSGRDLFPLSDFQFPGSSSQGLSGVTLSPPYDGLSPFRTPGTLGLPTPGSSLAGSSRNDGRLGSRGGRGGLPGLPETHRLSNDFDLVDQPFHSSGPTRSEEDEAAEGWGSKGWGGDSAGVKKTSFDAASSKLSASLLGYFPDEFLKHFVTQPPRMQPLINRGYYSRVEAIRRLIVFFLEDAERLSRQRLSAQPAFTATSQAQPRPQTLGKPLELSSSCSEGAVAQIVNIGAGADTTGFFIARWGGAVVYDVDFPDVCQEKAAVIRRVSELRECLGKAEEGPVHDPCVIRSSNYRLVAVDIRNREALKCAMKTAGLRDNLPTLFLCECVLVYLRVEEADAVVQWASECVPLAPSALIIYEQFNPNDPFGRMMARNLQIRNCPLLTITKYPTLESQRTRFAERGWPECSLTDMRSVYENFLPKSERDRVQMLEIFDELEEWWLIQSHYFLGVLVRPASPNVRQVFSEMLQQIDTWKLRKSGSSFAQKVRGLNELPGRPSTTRAVGGGHVVSRMAVSCFLAGWRRYSFKFDRHFGQKD